MDLKRDKTRDNKGSSCVLEEQMKNITEPVAETNKANETLNATLEATNDELQKTNANPSQLWVTAKEVLNKVNVNEEKTKERKNLN